MLDPGELEGKPRGRVHAWRVARVRAVDSWLPRPRFLAWSRREPFVGIDPGTGVVGVVGGSDVESS